MVLVFAEPGTVVKGVEKLVEKSRKVWNVVEKADCWDWGRNWKIDLLGYEENSLKLIEILCNSF